MGVHRFIGTSARDAMRQVRESLGDEALILSNRQVEGGVEIVAMLDADQESLTGYPAEPAPEAPEPVAPVSVIPEPAPTPAAPPAGASAPQEMQAFSARLMDEFAAMRDLLDSRLSAAPTVEQERATPATRLRQRMIGVGFSQTLVRELIELLPPEFADTPEDTIDETLNDWISRQLATRLELLDTDSDLLAEGGVMALIGPTGVGKTTTTAKLASRYVMDHGNRDAALITTDSYRIGAQEQLRIYARLLGVEVHALEGDGDLGALLARLMTPRRALLQMQRATPKRTILIDTLGMSQRDPRLATEVARLGEAGVPIQTLLVLDAASHGDTLEQVVAAYQQAALQAGTPIRGCIITKLDESARPATVLDILARHRLQVLFVANGQRVPEDLAAVDVAALVNEALAVDSASPFGYDAATLAEMAGHTRQSKAHALSRDVVSHGRSLHAMFDTLARRAPGTALLEQLWTHGVSDASGESFAAHMAARSPLTVAPGEEHALWWSKEGGSRRQDWSMPLVSLDDHGLPLPQTWLRHRLPASEPARMRWARETHQSAWHLMAAPPAIDEMHRLAADRQLWMSATTAARRVRHQGERQRLVDLAGLAAEIDQRQCRWRARPVNMVLSCLPALYETRGSGAPVEVLVWFARLHDVDDNRVLARRYWLSNAVTGRDVASRLARAVALEGLEGLTRQAMRRLEESGVARSDRETRLQLASGLAALATRLELCSEDWAMDVRAQLFNLSGGTRRRTGTVLLEALLQAFTARDALMDARGARA
ncbi:flagellar biosynthesis protein FlhF [Kushneria phyllosphaerae]|uniref:Flagellar biosynthesis protein FlhF n=1 Tax=Kushneria phyllosphaerae TaxID=2100822 RepID=A0A2R8CJH0_9GAMM|nr:flagellar biosynthesis protein FlhF [Kushneria phyllosphaerae]SPJ33049.1 Flagellar biosynthesis protein FlhF [Kushneria phyllosphaerae]